MSSSLFVTSIGFILAGLGATMIYLSLKVEPEDIKIRGLNFLKTPIKKINESKKLIKFVIIIGITVTGLIYAASWIGLLAW